MMYPPKTHMEELLLEALFASAVYGKSFPTRTPGYSARIERNSDVWWQDGQLEATLIIKPDERDEEIPRLMDMEALPIFLSVKIQEAIENTEIPDRVTICWELPVNPWTGWDGLSERWPVTPGPFLRKPEGGSDE